MKVTTSIVALIFLLSTLAGCRDTPGETRILEHDALLRAARAGHAETVQTMLRAPGRDINVRDENGRTPLIEAARSGHNDVVQALLVGGADVKLKDKQGKTSLMYAAEGGHTETVKLLRQGGATE